MISKSHDAKKGRSTLSLKSRRSTMRAAVLAVMSMMAWTCTAFPASSVAAQPAEASLVGGNAAQATAELGRDSPRAVRPWSAINNSDVYAESDARSAAVESAAAAESIDSVRLRTEPLQAARLRRLKRAELRIEHMLKAKEVIHRFSAAAIGTQIDVEIAGQSYVAVIERHFHPEGGATKPWGYHPGVSLFVERAPRP